MVGSSKLKIRLLHIGRHGGGMAFIAAAFHLGGGLHAIYLYLDRAHITHMDRRRGKTPTEKWFCWVGSGCIELSVCHAHIHCCIAHTSHAPQ
jgi:hypothetical protein